MHVVCYLFLLLKVQSLLVLFFFLKGCRVFQSGLLLAIDRVRDKGERRVVRGDVTRTIGGVQKRILTTGAVTNHAQLSIEGREGGFDTELRVVHAAIDNLLKGASGQAVQNMNLMFGLEETTGLLLKASAF